MKSVDGESLSHFSRQQVAFAGFGEAFEKESLLSWYLQREMGNSEIRFASEMPDWVSQIKGPASEV